MKYIAHLTFAITLTLLSSCGKQAENADHKHEAGTDGNDQLYNEVMKIHDEVMPKMNDLYKMKEELKKQIADSPDMVDEKRKEIEDRIAKLEEASKSMMVWMREFSPPADSLGEAVVKEYLEGQLEAVKKVRENIQAVMPQENN